MISSSPLSNHARVHASQPQAPSHAAGHSRVQAQNLYVTSGPWFGTVPYNPAQLTVRRVGAVTWNVTSVLTGILSYSVDGVAVTKYATRQTLVNEDYNGHFAGGIHETDTGCANPSFNGTIETVGILNISQNGSAITMTSLPSTGGSCAYA